MQVRRFTEILFPLLLASCASVAASAQTDLALSFYGAFNQDSNSGLTVQSPANAAGGLAEVRHLSNPLVGFEATYAFNRANQTYLETAVPASCPSQGQCPVPFRQSVSSNAHEVTVDWVPSLKIANLRPFGVLGAGLLLDVPSSSGTSTQNSTKAVYVYGAGLDWGLLPHIGLRLQYRGNLYKVPDVSKLYTSADAFTHTAEPMIGVYFRL